MNPALPKCWECGRLRVDAVPVHPRVRWGAAQKSRGGNGFSTRTVRLCLDCRRGRRGQYQLACSRG